LTLVALGVVMVLGATATFVGAKVLGNRYEGSVNRKNLLGDAASDTPAKVKGPLTFLVIGTDSREGRNSNKQEASGTTASVGTGERSDTIILMHVPASMDRAYVMSIPRDSYVPIANTEGEGSSHKDKINAAYNKPGGAPRLVKTVQNLTGLKIDYPVIVDFAAVRQLTDLVGGVDVVVDQTSYDESRFMAANTKYPTTKCFYNGAPKRCLTFNKGPLHLDGELAEYYVRQRKGLPGGDFDRAKRQQQFLRALMTKAVSNGSLTDLGKFDKLVRTVAGALTVDNSMPVQGLAFTLKGLRPADMVFMTLPSTCCGTEPGAGSVVYVNKPQIAELAAAINGGTMDQYLLKYPTAANDVSHGS
jgi:LCP family protein required for cell wall assembly